MLNNMTEYNRFLITSLNHFNYIKINFKQSYLKENFRYTELSKNIDSRYIAETYLTNINIKLDKQKRRFHFGSTYNFNIINNNNYINETIDENQFSIYGSAELLYNYLKLNTTIRKEWESNYDVPILPSISMEINLNNHNKLKIRYAKNFRAPTFNDRFWLSSSSVGNENLNSENADNYEIGYNIQHQNYRFKKYLYTHCMLTIGLHGQKKTVYGLQKILKRYGVEELNLSFNLNIEIQMFL